MSDVEAGNSILDRPYIRYSIAIIAVVAALLLHQGLVQLLGHELPPFIVVFPAIMTVALLCGLWPGVLTTILASLAVDYWIMLPRGSFAIANSADAIALAIFFGMGIFMSLVAGRYRRNQRLIAAYKREQALRESEAKLRQSEKQFETLANAIPQLCWMANPDGWIFWYNQRWYSYTGTTPQQMEGWGWQSVHDPEMLPGVLERWKASIATGELFDMVVPLRGVDGEFRPFLTRVMPVKDEQGKIVRWFGTNTDISEQKRVEDALRESRERLRLFINHAPAALAMFDREMRYLHASQRWLANNGLDGRDLRGLSHYEVIPDIPERFKQNHRRGLAGEVLREEADCFKRADGSVQWLRWEIHPWYEARGAIGGIVIFTEDITEERQAEEALRRQAEMLRLSYDAIMVWRLDGGIEGWNHGAEQLYGYSESEALGRVTHQLLRTIRSVPWPEVEAQLRQSGNWEGELRHTTKDGREVFVSTRHQLIVDADGVERILEINRDITEHKQAEERLRQLNRALRARSDSNQALLHATSEPEFLQQVCRIVREDCGHAMVWIGLAEDDEEKNVRPVAHAGFEQGYLETLRVTWSDSERGRGPTGTSIRTGQPSMCRNMLTDPAFLPWREEAIKRGYGASLVLPLMEGDTAFGAITIYSREPDAFAVGEVNLLTELANDLSYGIATLRLRVAHAQAEAALRKSEERWATTLQSIGDAVISTDAAGKIEFMNDVAQKLTGWTLPEARGRALTVVFDILHEETRIKPENPVAKVIRLGKVVGLANHTALIARNRTEIPIEDSAAPIRGKNGEIEGVVLVFHDVSEQRRSAKAMRISDRLATTGRLAATIAHEIHNPLDTVSNLLYLIGQDPQADSTPEYVSMASRELARITQMTQRMLSFQREAAKPVPVKITEVLENVAALYERKIKAAGIDLKQEVEFDGHILAMPGELRQIFANLVGNAVEAVGSRRGTIILRAYASRDRRNHRPGLRVVVADDGPGIPVAVRPRIFEPFFTTKGESGTGLGLWITSDIIRKYDGTLRLRTSTQPSFSGTCFSIFFPFEGRVSG